MKKVLLLAAAILTAATNINAQNGYDNTKHEVAVSSGMITTSQLFDAYFGMAIAMAGAKYSNGKFTGPFSAEYFYHVSEWFGVGGIVVFGSSRTDYATTTDEGTTKEGTIDNRYFSVLPAMKFDWCRTKYFGMYSKLGLGYTFRTISIDNSDTPAGHFNLQLSLLGIEGGWPRLRAFVEGGIGEQGMLAFGIRYKF